MTPQEIKAECERIWKEEPLRYCGSKAGWLPSIHAGLIPVEGKRLKR